MLDCLRACSDEDTSQQYEAIRNRMKAAKAKTQSQFGILFHEFDYQFYKAVLYFHDGKYAEASKNFKRALDII